MEANVIINQIMNHDTLLLESKHQEDAFFLIYREEDWEELSIQLERAFEDYDESTVSLDVLCFKEVDEYIKIHAPETIGLFVSGEWEVVFDPNKRYLDYLDTIEEVEEMDFTDLYGAIYMNAVETSEEILGNLSEIMALIENFNYRFKQLNQLEKMDTQMKFSGKTFYQMMKLDKLSNQITDPYMQRIFSLHEVTQKMLSQETESSLAIDHLSNLLKLHFITKSILMNDSEYNENEESLL